VVPNASKTLVDGVCAEEGKIALKLRLQAPPVDDKANAALIKWMAITLGLGQRALELVRGKTNRQKQLAMRAENATLAEWPKLMAMLEPLEYLEPLEALEAKQPSLKLNSTP
jgi:hypothetical protein